MKKILVFMSISAFSCGKSNNSSKTGNEQDPATDSNSQGTAKLFKSSEDLPACEASREGWLVYITSESGFRVCESKSWNQIDVGKKSSILVAKDSSGRIAGELIDFDHPTNRILLLFPDGKFFYSYISNSDLVSCGYVSADCSGQCYTNTSLPKDSVFIFGPNFLITGEEERISIASTKAPGIACQATVVQASLRPATAYTHPDGITSTFNFPLTISKISE